MAYASDIMFKNREELESIYPKLVEHGSLYMGKEDILTFFGRKLHGNFK